MTNIVSNDLGFTSENELIIPRGRKGLPPIKIDMKVISDVEAILPSMVHANALTFPDIVMKINLALIRLSKIIATIEMELKESKRLLEESKAIALLDRAEDILKSKGQKSSSDTREAVVTLDQDVRENRQKFDILTATLTMIINIKEDFSKSYFSAKTILDANSSLPDQGNYAGNLKE